MKKIVPSQKSSFIPKSKILSILAEGNNLVHFSAHGHFNFMDPFQSGIHLKEGLDKISSLEAKLEPYILNIGDLLRTRIKVKTVALSSCKTALNMADASDELLGTISGFLAAGAETVIAPMWNVYSFDSSSFFIDYYSQVKNEINQAISLKNAQINLKKISNDPFRWAPYVLWGSFL